MHGLGLVPTVQPLNPANLLSLLRHRLTAAHRAMSTSPPPRSLDLDRFHVAVSTPLFFLFRPKIFSTEFRCSAGGRGGGMDEYSVGREVGIILYIYSLISIGVDNDMKEKREFGKRC